jgi:hypothetical protein
MSNDELKAMNEATASATPEELLGKIKMIIAVLAGLLDKFNGKLTIWQILFNATVVIEAIRSIIQIIKAKPPVNA